MQQKPTRLFVIIDPSAAHQVALVKALLIAKLGYFHIHAYACVYQDIKQVKNVTSRKDFKHHVLEETKGWLQELMKPCEISGVPYSTEVVWNSRWVESALHAAAKSGCDLMIKSSFHHSKARRFFSKTSDYSLMRYSSCPILFTHETQEWLSNKVLACVDLESGDPQHIRLNNVIIRNARALADVMGMELHIAACYVDHIDTGHLPIKTPGHQVSAEQLAELYDVESGRVILKQGPIVESLQNICEITDASILIMGSLARTGIAGKFIGNTAEKLLDLVDADILTVN